MEIILENKEAKKLIKKYYRDNYSIKTCKVKMEAQNIQDRIKEIDLFSHDDFFYNVVLNTTISGKMIDNNGKVNKYVEHLDEEGTKSIICTALEEQYDVNYIKCGYKFVKEVIGGDLEAKLIHFLVDIDKKNIKKYEK